MLLHETYTYPSHPHPHKTFLSQETKDALMNLFLNGISQYDVEDIITRKTSALEYTKNRSNRLQELSITQDHVVLLDTIFDEMNQNISRFILHGVEVNNLEDEENMLHYGNARKAAIEYYFFEPCTPDKVLSQMRQYKILHPKRPNISKEKLDEFLEKQPMRWDQIHLS